MLGAHKRCSGSSPLRCALPGSRKKELKPAHEGGFNQRRTSNLLMRVAPRKTKCASVGDAIMIQIAVPPVTSLAMIRQSDRPTFVGNPQMCPHWQCSLIDDSGTYIKCTAWASQRALKARHLHVGSGSMRSVEMRCVRVSSCGHYLYIFLT